MQVFINKIAAYLINKMGSFSSIRYLARKGPPKGSGLLPLGFGIFGITSSFFV